MRRGEDERGWSPLTSLEKKKDDQIASESALVGGGSAQDWCRRGARQRALDSKSALVVGRVLRQNKKEVRSFPCFVSLSYMI